MNNPNLTQAFLRECLSYNPSTGALTWKRRPREHFPTERGFLSWNARFPGRRAGTVNDQGYRQIKLFGVMRAEHRLVWLLVYGEWPSQQIDHINREPHDNRLANLRDVSNAENARNAKEARDTASGVKGVTWNCASRKWQARIHDHAGRRLNLGFYEDVKDAIRARSSANETMKYHPKAA